MEETEGDVAIGNYLYSYGSLWRVLTTSFQVIGSILALYPSYTGWLGLK
jgi:hypothetical protein